MQGLLAGPLHTCCSPGAAISTATFSKSTLLASARGRQSQAPGLPRERGQWFLTPQALGGLKGICFDRTCQDAQDHVFLAVVGVPLLCLAAAVIYQFLKKPPEEVSDGVCTDLRRTNSELAILAVDRALSETLRPVLFLSPQTAVNLSEMRRSLSSQYITQCGKAVLRLAAGILPSLCSNKGELAFRAQSYTPWPVDSAFEGQRLRIPVGPVQGRAPRTYVFKRVLGASSRLLQTSLPRPLGIVFEEDAARRRVVVSAFLDGSPAAQLAQRARLDHSQSSAAPAVGDVLRACTCTNIVYPQDSLFGAKAPERHVVVYGADQETWPRVMTALRKGDRADGDVTLVLERHAPPPD